MRIRGFYIILGAAALLPLFGYGTPPSPEEADKAGLIELQANRLEGNVRALDSLFVRMGRLRGSNDAISILHLGDSHIQAGYLTNVVRTRLQSAFGNAGRGLVLPLNLMRTNEPEGYRITSPNAWEASRCAVWNIPFEVGIGGVAISTQDGSAEFTISADGDPFNQITVFHHAKAPRLVGDPVFETGLSCPIDDTEYSTRIILNQLTRQATLRADMSLPEFSTPTFYGFSLENGQPGILYHSAGVNGSSYEYINRSPGIAQQSGLLHPDLIILSLGTNDAYTTRFNAGHVYTQIENLVTRLRAVNPEAAILMATPMEFYSRTRVKGVVRYAPNKNVAEMRNLIIRAAKAYDLPYWDLYRVAGGGAMERWRKAGLTYTDRIHLLREGYELQGELLYRALSERAAAACEEPEVVAEK